MRRRAFVASIGSSALLPFAWPCSVAAQTPQKTYRVAHLAAPGRTPDGAPPQALRDRLRQLGYVEGRNVVYDARFAEGNIDRLPGLAAELLSLKPDVIVAQGGTSVVAAKQATSTVPIVIASASGDAVATGLIASLARPGGNITGLSDETDQLSGKRMQLLKEAVPGVSRVAVLWNASDPGMTLRYRAIEKAAGELGVKVEPLALHRPADFDAAFATMASARPDAMFLVTDVLTNLNQKRVIDFALTQRLPAMYESNYSVRQGGLISYGPTFEAMFRRAADYVDRILKGASPADLPAEQPMEYNLSLNLKTAGALGVTLPQTVLLRADEVVE